jgi:hypothetical protein
MTHFLKLIILCLFLFCRTYSYGQRNVETVFNSFEIIYDSISKTNDTVPLPYVDIFIIDKSNNNDTVGHYITNTHGTFKTSLSFFDLYNNSIIAKKENYQTIMGHTGAHEPNLKSYIHDFTLTRTK